MTLAKAGRMEASCCLVLESEERHVMADAVRFEPVADAVHLAAHLKPVTTP